MAGRFTSGVTTAGALPCAKTRCRGQLAAMEPPPVIANRERKARRLTSACARMVSPPMDAYNRATFVRTCKRGNYGLQMRCKRWVRKFYGIGRGLGVTLSGRCLVGTCTDVDMFILGPQHADRLL